jgi:predicted double-glycine peptidase
MDTRKLKKHGSILCALAVLAAVSSLPAASSRILERPDLLKRVRAWSAGATLVAADAAVMQTRRNDCGPAALKMVLDAHGIERPLKALSEEVGLTGRGTSLGRLRAVAARLGLPGRSWVLSPEDLANVPLPAIAFIRKNHFVVIRRLAAPQVLEVDDPALGRLRWPAHAFRRIWSGETLIFDPAWTPPCKGKGDYENRSRSARWVDVRREPMNIKQATTALLLTMLLALSAGGVPPDAVGQELGPNAEEAVMGGNCDGRWGLFGGLLLGAFTPCGVLCATGAWLVLPTLENC